MSAPEGVRIRAAAADEADALTDLILRSKRSNGYDDAFMDACRDELTVTPEALMERPHWIAEDGVLLGCACLDVGERPGAAEVRTFFIDPRHQRKGVGRRLWRKIRDEARARGVEVLHLDADPFATPFYEKLGFRVVGETPSGSIPGRALPRMELRLD